MLGSLINEVPAKMRKSDNRIRKLHEALLRLRVELRLGGTLFEPSCVGAALLPKQSGLLRAGSPTSEPGAIPFSAANFAFSSGLFGVAHLVNRVSAVTEECARMVSFYLREAQWR